MIFVSVTQFYIYFYRVFIVSQIRSIRHLSMIPVSNVKALVGEPVKIQCSRRFILSSTRQFSAIAVQGPGVPASPTPAPVAPRPPPRPYVDRTWCSHDNTHDSKDRGKAPSMQIKTINNYIH